MNAQSKQLKARLLIGSMLFFALCINFQFLRMAQIRRVQEWQEQQAETQQAAAQKTAQNDAIEQAKVAQQAATERENAIQEAAEVHAKYLVTYLNSGFTRQSGVKTVAVVAASESSEFNSTITDTLASRFKTEPVEMLPTFFKPAFVSDGLFNIAFDGSDALFEKLELANSLDALLLARENVQYTSSPSLQNVITATMKLDIAMWTVAGQAETRTWTFTTAGAGFKQEDARAMAEQRLVKMITTDTNMYLVQKNQNH